MTDEEAAESIRALDYLPVIPAPEFARWEPHPVNEINAQSSSTRLTEIKLRLLKTVVKQPGKAATFYTKLAGINGRRAAEIRRQLVAAGYLREHSVAAHSRGRTAIVLEPLPPAFEAISESNNHAR